MYIEIELDGLIAAKRCPLVKDPNGEIDRGAIRNYFQGLGYRVGSSFASAEGE